MRPPVAMNTPPPKASGKPAAVAVGSLFSRPPFRPSIPLSAFRPSDPFPNSLVSLTTGGR